MAPPPKVRLPIRKGVPRGYIIGRVSPGTGDAQLLDVSEVGQQLAAAAAMPGSPAGTIGLTPIANNRVLANVSGSTAVPSATALTQPAAGLTITGGASAFTFALANDLAALEAMSGTGLVVRTASETYAQRSLVAPAAGITITNPAGIAGDPTFALADDLAALEAMAGTGLVARTAANTYAQRTLTGPAAGISVSNGDGVAGNPTLALANDLAAVEGLASTGLAVRTAADTWTTRTITGTANRLTVTNGDGVAGAPTLDISASYVGQATITTLGTIGTGTWQGTVVTGQYGGTGVANTGKTITLGGNLTTSGAFATTLTVTATTNSTLPAGTHTLAGLDVAQTWTAQQIWAYDDAGAYPASTTKGWTVTSDFPNDGGARVDFWNLDTAAGSDKFAWLYKTGASTAVQLAQWLGDATFVEFDQADPVTPARLVFFGKLTGGEGYTGTFGADDFTIYTNNVARVTFGGSTGNATFFKAPKIAGATSGTLTLAVPAVAGTNTLTFPAGTTDFSATGGASQVVKQTSAGGAFTVAQLAASDLSNGATGSGNVVLATAPTIAGGSITALTTFSLRDTSAAFNVTLAATSSTALTAGRTLTLDVVNAARTLKLGANLTIASDPGAVSGAMKSNGTGTFAQAAASDLSNGTTGSGSVVLATSPSLTTPTLGVASATTINKLTITTPAAGSTLTIADGKTLTANNSITFAGTDSTTMTFPTTSKTVMASDYSNGSAFLRTSANPSNPTGTTSTAAFKMMGCAGSFTPAVTGRMLIIAQMNVTNSTSGDGTFVQTKYGTGSAPANGDAATGTALQSAVRSDAAAASDRDPVTLIGYAALSVGTTYWLDVALEAITGGTSSVANVSFNYIELP